MTRQEKRWLQADRDFLYQQLEVKFGNCLAQFTFDYDRGTFINSNRFL